jgi:hypothetical protein
MFVALFDRSVKLLLAFSSAVIPGFILEIHDPRFLFSLRHVRVSKWGLLFNEGGIGLSM